MAGIIYIADKKLRELVERHGLETTLKCRTIAQLIKMHEIGLVPSNVAEQAKKYFNENCRELSRAVFETFD